MAPGDPVARRNKAKAKDYSNVGVKGRATGLEVRDTGERDEYGFELAETYFGPSSTTKAAMEAARRRKSDITITSSVDMDIAESSEPEPEDVLTGKSTKMRLPPPRQSPVRHSPMRGAPQRHSVGPISSPLKRLASQVPATTPTQKAALLDFSVGTTRSALRTGENSSPTRSPSRVNGMHRRPPRASTFSPPASPETGRNVTVNNRYADELEDVTRTDVDVVPRLGDDDGPWQADADPENSELLNLPQRATPRSRQLRASEIPNQSPGSGSSARKRGRVSSHMNDERPSPKRARGSDTTGLVVDDEPVMLGREDDEYQEEELVSEGDASVADEDNQLESAQPVIELEPEPDPASEPETRAEPNARGRSKKSALAPKDKNRKIAKVKNIAATKKSQPEFKKPAMPGPGPRPAQRPRHVTPGDDGQDRTRSGRVVYAPLQYWKGEKNILKPHDPYTVEEVLRMDDVTPIKREQRNAAKRRKHKNANSSADDEAGDSGEDGAVEDEENGPAEWEVTDGVIEGQVRMWDSERQLGTAETRNQEIAFAASRIEVRDANVNANFRFAKVLTLPFFGMGMVELPPEGFKKTKNSRRMHMVFFVHYGKVDVEVGDTQFQITKGGVWQVPRGNFYSIRNHTRRKAKIFFAQGCELDAEDDRIEPSVLETR